MVPYIILFVCLVFGGFLEVCRPSVTVEQENQKGKYKNAYAIMPVLIIYIIGFFRETSVGGDSESYVTFYWSQINLYTWNDLFSNFSMDNGFYTVLKTFALLTDDWWLVRGMLFVLTFSLYCIPIMKKTDYPCVALLIFIGLTNIHLMFGALRQALANGICFYACKYLEKKEWLKFAVFVLIAATVHKTALVSFFALIICLVKPKRLSYYKLFVLSGFSAIVFYIVIPVITSIYNPQAYQDGAISEGGYGMLFFVVVVFVVVGYLMNYISKNEESNEENTLLEDRKWEVALYNISCGALFMQIGALQWSLLTRVTVYFSIFWCLLFPKLLKSLSQKNRIQVYLVLVVLFGFMFFYQFYDLDVFVIHKF